MKRVPALRFFAWILVLTFVPQIALAEIAPSDGQPRSQTPDIKAEVVPSDGQPRTTVPPVSREVVPSDGQPRSGTPAVAREVVPSDGQPKMPTNVPAINPFVGEVAVGVSLLVTYGPQIVALAATVATLAAAVNVVIGHGKMSFDLVKSIGQKLQRLVSIVLGPLAISNGMTQDGVQGLSNHLLQVTKFVTSNLSTPVNQVQDQVNASLQMSREVSLLAQRGKNVALDVKGLSQSTQAELKQILAGGEVQLFRDGAHKVAGTIGRQADGSAGAFNQTLENTKMTTATLEAMKIKLDKAVAASGKSAGEVTLYDIKMTGAQLSKQLIDARKNMVLSNKVLADNGKAVSGVHSEIISLLEDVKTEMEIFAQNNGVKKNDLDRLLKDKGFQADVAAPVVVGKSALDREPMKLSGEIGFMVDDLAKISEKNVRQMKQFEAQKTAAGTASSFTGANFGDDELYKKMVSEYKEYLSVTTGDPGNKDAVAAARKNFEAAQKAYQESLEK